MIEIPEPAITVWRSYYFSANSVGYLVDKAESDINAKKLSAFSSSELLDTLKHYLSTPPEDVTGLVAPYLITAALFMKSDATLDVIEMLDAPHAKWFREFAVRIFKKRKSILSSSYVNINSGEQARHSPPSKTQWYST